MCGGCFSEICVVFKVVQQQLNASRVVLALYTVLNTFSVLILVECTMDKILHEEMAPIVQECCL